MTIQYRLATLSDSAELRTCLQHIVSTERPMDACLQSGHIEYYDPLTFIKNENASLIVAVDEGNNEGAQIIACGAAEIKATKHYYHYDQILYLAMMYVHTDYRGEGINGEIMQQLLAWGKTRGVDNAKLTVYPQNPSAIRAYEKLGFEPALLEMRLRSNE